MKNHKSKLRLMLEDKYSDQELDFILKYEYKGKNAAQWYHLSKTINELNYDGTPKWIEYLVNFEDTITLGAIRIKCKKQIEEFTENI